MFLKGNERAGPGFPVEGGNKPTLEGGVVTYEFYQIAQKNKKKKVKKVPRPERERHRVDPPLNSKYSLPQTF